MRRPIAWLTQPDPLDDQLTRERARHNVSRRGTGRAFAAAMASLALLVVLLAAIIHSWLASPELWP